MEAWSLHMLGSSRIRIGEVDEGEHEIEDALRLFHASGDVAGITLAIDDLASVARGPERPAPAPPAVGRRRALSSAAAILLADMVDENSRCTPGRILRTSMDPTSSSGTPGRAA
jgi:hypothetical protein